MRFLKTVLEKTRKKRQVNCFYFFNYYKNELLSEKQRNIVSDKRKQF